MQDEFILNGSLQDLENFFCPLRIAQNQADMPAHFKDDLQKGKYHSGDILPEEYDEGNRGKRHKDLVGHEDSQRRRHELGSYGESRVGYSTLFYVLV